MKRHLLSSVLFASVGLALHCGPAAVDCEETHTCADPGAGDGGVGDGATTDVQVPVGCNPKKDPKDAPECVVDGFGLFVDGAAGADTNQGTKASPLKTLGAAVKAASGRRVYVCEGTYGEAVKLTGPGGIFGGFACGTWTYSGKKPVIAGPADLPALVVEKVAGELVVADVAVTAAAATLDGGSSIAAFVSDSSGVVFRRVDLEARDGKAGKKGADGATGTITAVTGGGAVDGKGYPASGTTAGAQKTCTCSTGGTSTGGGGGAANGGGGATGQPEIGSGGGGQGKTSCGAAEPNGTGNDGANASPSANAPQPATRGTVASTGWTPASGAAGTSGLPGQGGGGGGGFDIDNAGGGGGCGGCGGSGGQGGQGGGASIALVSIASTITLDASTLKTAAAGAGGAGGASGPGASGGTPGVGLCPGGSGGKGGAGGAGSGGAGGISVGVVTKGPKPTLTATTIATGTPGAKGTGGAPGVNDGPDGIKADSFEAN